LLECHRKIWDGDWIRRTLIGRDIAYAVAVHEWYRSTDPSRLLTLAREANLSIDGAEWASPTLLSGRLAIKVLDHQYNAGSEIGDKRLKLIESMIINWVKGSGEADPLEQIFYVAIQLQESGRGATDSELRASAFVPGNLSTAYQIAIDERSKRVRQAGLRLVQELHLLDAHNPPLDSDPEDLEDQNEDVYGTASTTRSTLPIS